MSPMSDDGDFWQRLDGLVADYALVVDRPRGTAHPDDPSFIYPLDYGYLEGTHAADGGGIDVWLGSLPGRQVTAIVCTIDLAKRDAELKVLVGCTGQEARDILAIHNIGWQSAVLVERQ
jgi:inorganic pyrophosphatase